MAELLTRFIPAALLAVGALALLIAALIAVGKAEAAPFERSCDGKPATFHVNRAEALIRHAYRDARWEDSSPAKDREKRAWQAHKACVRDAELRASIEEYRERQGRALRAVPALPGGGGVPGAGRDVVVDPVADRRL